MTAADRARPTTLIATRREEAGTMADPLSRMVERSKYSSHPEPRSIARSSHPDQCLPRCAAMSAMIVLCLTGCDHDVAVGDLPQLPGDAFVIDMSAGADAGSCSATTDCPGDRRCRNGQCEPWSDATSEPL